MPERYDVPGPGARAVNYIFRRLAEFGISVQGSTALRVRGRTSGRIRGVVVNLLELDGRRYLVSPRGNTQWARNARAAGEIEIGPKWRSHTGRLVEVTDAAKPAVLKPYLARWFWQLKGHVGGLTPNSTDEQLQAAAPSIPVFEIVGQG